MGQARSNRNLPLAILMAGFLVASLSPALSPATARADVGGPGFYSNGLHPGSTLAGRTLPVDWSTRRSPCEAPEYLRREGDLCPGDTSWRVFTLQLLLAERKLFRSEFTGVYDQATRYAVFTFHKLTGPAHTDPATARAEWIASPPPDDWVAEDWDMLRAFTPLPPTRREHQPDRVEVDIGHQILYLIEGGSVSAIMPVSTGAGRGTVGCRAEGCGASVTPRTDRLDDGSVFIGEHRYARGWSPRPGAWSIYKFIYYRGQYGEWNYGIHGYRNVPNYPASHGCIRVTPWDMDFLRPWAPEGGYDQEAARVEVGMPIHVWDEIEIDYSAPTDGLH
ncbi:MAG TPA: L,D-transpeptidase [Acidimicrobiia bacterium]|nr:L,D-transpeptidase [Acidimicrobiia bacterium]